MSEMSVTRHVKNIHILVLPKTKLESLSIPNLDLSKKIEKVVIK